MEKWTILEPERKHINSLEHIIRPKKKNKLSFKNMIHVTQEPTERVLDGEGRKIWSTA